MQPTTCTRTFDFDAAHRVLGHEGKCRHLHGHRYKIEVECQAWKLNDLGMVLDFGKIKQVLGDWINENWDHNILLNEQDPQVLHLRSTEERTPFLMGSNPTAENIAEFFIAKAQELLTHYVSKGITVIKVRVYETPNCWAEAAL